MLISRLLRSILSFLSPGIVPDEGGGTAPAPAPASEPAAAPEGPAAPAPAPAAAAPSPAPAADPFDGLRGALDTVGKDPAAGPAPAPAPGQPRDAQGQFAGRAQIAAGAAAPTPPAPAAHAPAAPPAAPKPGEVDLTPPEGMTERAQARWAQLTERVKTVPELERRATEATQQLDSVRQMVSTAGLGPQEFTDILEMGRLFKSNTPAEMQQALQRIDALRTNLAVRLGVDAPAPDALSAHPDLLQKVGNMLITREDALEIAKLRQQGQQAQQTLQGHQDLQQFQQTVQGAAASMEKTLAARAGTPGHDAKVQYIAKHFANPENLQKFVRTYQPNQWESALMLMYESFVAPALPPVPPPGPQPLRPNNVRSGAAVQTGPMTAGTALENAFAQVGM